MYRLTAFETFCKFLALKNHFTQKKYDYFKYRGKVTASKDSFLARRDRFQFQKLSRQYDEKELELFIVANLVAGKSWVTDLMDSEAHENYQAFRRQIEAITYTFEQELTKAFQSVKEPKELFRVSNGQYPKLLELHLSGTVSLPTLSILNVYVDYFDKFDERIGADDPIWSKVRDCARKLLPFITYDREKIKSSIQRSIDQVC